MLVMNGIDNIVVPLLHMLFFHLMNLIPVCSTYPKELLQDCSVDKTNPSVRQRVQHPALFSIVTIRTVSA